MSNLSNNSASSAVDNTKPEKTGIAWTSWIIVAAFLIPMALAYLIFTTGFGLPQHTINHGDLLVPATSVLGVNITNVDGDPLDLQASPQKWRWLLVGTNDCRQTCQNQLYTSRQVHIRLAEKSYRVERLYLNTDPRYSAAFAEQLRQEHPSLVMAHVDAQAWKSLLAHVPTASELNGEIIYVVDQEGFAMMTYDSQHEGADLLEDMKRLLKYSYEDIGR